MSSEATPRNVGSPGQLGALVACPICGADDGYTLTDGSTYRWWIVSCAGCGNDLGECHADRTLKHGAAKPERWEWADDHWNQVGAYAQSLRSALATLVHAVESLDSLAVAEAMTVAETVLRPNARGNAPDTART